MYKKRFFRFYIKLRQFFKSDKRVKYPKNVSEQESIGFYIFIHVLRSENSKLYYDISSHECYLMSGDSKLYIFLESGNLKVINSVYGYDIKLSKQMEMYIGERFSLELSKRRSKFKKDALSKISHSLEKTKDALNKKITSL